MKNLPFKLELNKAYPARVDIDLNDFIKHGMDVNVSKINDSDTFLVTCVNGAGEFRIYTFQNKYLSFITFYGEDDTSKAIRIIEAVIDDDVAPLLKLMEEFKDFQFEPSGNTHKGIRQAALRYVIKLLLPF